MFSIIQFQQGKGFGEILFQIQNGESFKKYTRNEKIAQYLYCIYGIFLFCLSFSYMLQKDFHTSWKPIVMWVLLANNLFMMFYMITLLVKLKKYHYYEYNVQKVSIISFGLFETFFVLILVYYIGHKLFRWGMTWN